MVDELKPVSTFHARRFLRNWRPLIALLAVAAWTVVTAGISAWWQYDQSIQNVELAQNQLLQAQKDRKEAQEEAKSDAVLTRRIEAQKPFLERKLALFFEVIQVAGHLTEFHLTTEDERWKLAVRRFWELRWAELEMVGDPGIRDAARRVGQQIVETEFKKDRNRHDLRWAVECFADELRMALEHAWGTDRSATRLSASSDTVRVSAGSGLPRDQTDPGREVPAGLEHIGISDRCSDCRGRNHTDARNGLEPLAHLALPMASEDRPSDRGDAHLQFVNLSHDQLDASPYRIRQHGRRRALGESTVRPHGADHITAGLKAVR